MISSCRSLPRRLESEPKSGVTLGRQLVLCNQENAPRRNLARDNCQRLWAACPKRAADADRSAPKQLPIKKQRNAVTKTVRNDACVHPMLQTKSNKNYTIVTLTRVFVQHHTAWHRKSHTSKSYRNTSRQITSYQITSYLIIPCNIALHHPIAHDITPHHIVSHLVISYSIISYHITAYQIISHHIIPQPITAYQIAS